MKNILIIGSKIIPVLGIIILGGITVSTSVLGMSKITKSLGQKNISVPNIQSQNTNQTTPSPSQTEKNSAKNEKESFWTNGASPTPTTTNTNKTAVNSKTTVPVGTATNITSTTQNNTIPNNLCIITLFGKQYDVTSLRNTHSGGNVFECGTDMTTTYQKQHGTNISRMQSYLYTGTTAQNTNSNATTTPTPTNNSTNTGEKKKDDDDRVDTEDENEKESESD